jgi:putative endonuclease
MLQNEKTAWVYILRCSDGSLYTGWTFDIEQRLKAHNSGRGAKYTRGRLPAVLAYSESAGSLPAALRREREIKGMTRSGKEALISGGEEPPLTVNPKEKAKK